MGWHEHEDGVFHGCEKFFRPGYAANLVSSWIPALDGVQEKLEAGARVADVGCGKGASTILMAKAFPNSQFFGFDYHAKSIEAAREVGAACRCRRPRHLRSVQGQRVSGQGTTISWRSSIACMTWAIRSGLPRMSGSR